MKFIRGVYGLLLSLFPREYRDEYGGELQAVFRLSIDDALEKGPFETADVVLRELIDLPKAIIHEHLRERRKAKMTGKFGAYFDFASGSWHEFLTALFPFVLAGSIPLLNYLGRGGLVSNDVGSVIALVLFVLFLILLVIGMNQGMPRWSLPYLGFLLAILSVYLLSAIFGTPIYFLFRNLRDQSMPFIDILWDGILWYGLLFAVAFLVVVSRVSPAFKRYKDDWTLPCFVLYGGVPFAMWLTFDEYVGDEPYMLLSLLVLVVGAWLYLRNTNDRKRFGILFAAMTLAMFIVAGGKLLLVPTQTWPITIDAGLARSEFIHTITIWGWFALGMILPLVPRLLSRSGDAPRISLSEE